MSLRPKMNKDIHEEVKLKADDYKNHLLLASFASNGEMLSEVVKWINTVSRPESEENVEELQSILDNLVKIIKEDQTQYIYLDVMFMILLELIEKRI